MFPSLVDQGRSVFMTLLAVIGFAATALSGQTTTFEGMLTLQLFALLAMIFAFRSADAESDEIGSTSNKSHVLIR